MKKCKRYVTIITEKIIEKERKFFMNKLFKNTLSALIGLIMTANLAVVPVLAEGEEQVSTSEITVYENYNHYLDGTSSITPNSDTMWTKGYNSTYQGSRDVTVLNYDLPDIDTSKLVSVKYEVVSKATGGAVNLYAGAETAETKTYIYPMVNRRMCSQGVTWASNCTCEEHVEKKTEVINNMHQKYDNTIKTSGILATTPAVDAVDKTITVEDERFTNFVKTQIEAGTDSINLALEAWQPTTQFYTRSNQGKEPKLIFVVDNSEADTELATLTADELKQFVNTYSAYYDVDAALIDEYDGAAVKSIYNKLVKIDGWNTNAGFKAAFEEATVLETEEVAAEYIGSAYFDANGSSRDVKLNYADLYFASNNARRGILGFEIPSVNNDSVKSVKLVMEVKHGAANSTVIPRAYENLDFSKITAGSIEENLLAVEKYLTKEGYILGYDSCAVVETANVYEEKTFDVTDYIKGLVDEKAENVFFTLLDTGTGVYIKSTTAKLVFEIEKSSTADELFEISTTEELDTFMRNSEKMSTFGMNSADYTKFAAPLYIAEYIMEKGYNTVDEFKAVFAEAVAEYTEVVTVDRAKMVYYGKGYYNPSLPITLNVGAAKCQTSTAQIYHYYDIPSTGRIMNATMSMTMPNAREDSNISGSIDVIAYTNVRPETMPANGEYADGGDVANAWLAYADTFTDGTLTLDGIGMGVIKTNDVEIKGAMLDTIKSAASDNGSGYFAVEFYKGGANLYIANSTITLYVDKTEALAMKARVIEEILSKEDNVSLDEYLKNMTASEASSVGLDLTDYKRFEYGYYVAEEALGASTIEEFKTKLLAGIEKYSTPITLNAVNNVYYREGTSSDTPMKTGFMAYNTNSSPSYGEIYFQYDLSDIDATIFSGTMYGNNVNTNTLVGGKNRTLNLARYSIVSPELPAKRTGKEDVEFFNKEYVNLYELGSAEAEAFNTWQTTDANFITDGKTTFTFAPEYGKVSDTISITDGLIAAINEAIAENGSKELMIELEDGSNVYSNGITFNLLIDGTVAAYEKEQREEALMSELWNVGTPEEMVELLESYDDILGLSENAQYQKVMDKTVVGQAVMDAIFDIAGIDDIITVINETSAANPPSKLMEITAIDYINEPEYDLDKETEGLEGTGYLGAVSVKKYDDLNTTATIVAAVYDKATGALLGLKSVDATDVINATGYGKTVKVNVGGYFVLGDDTTPTTEIKVFVWDSVNGMKSLTDAYEVDAVSTK